MHAYIITYMQACISAYARMYLRTFIHQYKRMHVRTRLACMYVCAYLCEHACRVRMYECIHNLHMCPTRQRHRNPLKIHQRGSAKLRTFYDSEQEVESHKSPLPVKLTI